MKKEVNETNAQKNTEAPSNFTGGLIANFFIGFIVAAVSLITFGLAYPMMVCWKLKWKASHTYLNGKQLVFDGSANQLFGKYALWAFLSVITLGLYYIFSAKVKLAEWETKHTHFAYYKYDENNNQSKFDGKWYQLFAVNLLCKFVTIITLTLGYYWAHCYLERWYCRHKTIDGCELEFDGTGIQYFGKRVVWTLLTFVTCGIYSLWMKIKSVKWTILHTKLLNMPNEDCFMSDEEIAALTQKAPKTKWQILCITGFCFTLMGFIIVCIYHGILFANFEGIILKDDFSGLTEFLFSLSHLFLVFTLIGIIISSIGRSKIASVDTKSKKFAIVGIILGATILELFVFTLFTPLGVIMN